MDKKAIRTIYKLRYYDKSKNTARSIALEVKRLYNIDMAINKLESYITRNFPPRGNKKLSDYEVSFLIRCYRNIVDKDKILSYFNYKFNKDITYTALITMMSKLKIKPYMRNYESIRKLSKYEELKIVSEYIAGKSSIQLFKQYGFKTHKSILDILHRYNKHARTPLENTKTEYDDLSFEMIDSDAKAYLLGLMLTDGYISHDRAGLQLTDYDCINFLHNVFHFPMQEIPKRKKSRKMYRITFSGKDRLQQLRNLGVVERKSLVLQGPKLELIKTECLKSVIRGIIDGDGWIRKDGKEFFICSASYDFTAWCKDILVNCFHFSEMDIKYITNDYNGIYCIRSAVKENINILRTVIYDVPFGMSRKYNRLHNII